MSPTILRTNATAVYRFLSKIYARLAEGEALEGKRTIAGPRAGFRRSRSSPNREMECVGIDASDSQLEAARAFVQKTGLEIELQRVDMREIPLPDASFDYVYEHFSMCHLSRANTGRAVAKMHRVLKPGGMAFFGVISSESWALSDYGEERAPGERWMTEGGEETRHSIFTDEECERLVSAWEVVSKKKAVFHVGGADISGQDWAYLRKEAPGSRSTEEWTAERERRGDYFRYIHTYYHLRKPSCESRT